MNWKVLKTEEDYNKASMRLMEIFHAFLTHWATAFISQYTLFCLVVLNFQTNSTQCLF
jgi:hypothetical protein